MTSGYGPHGGTIAALATPPGIAALAVIRVSGPLALRLLGDLTGIEEWPPRQARHVTLRQSRDVLDDVVAVCWRQPHSYTGEDVVEITCHGNPSIAQRILAVLLKRGARAAGPGEFTERAFLNGKLDLTEAEAVQDLIAASTETALRGARSMKEGKLSARLEEIRRELTGLLAHLEAYIDFPEEDIAPEVTSGFAEKLDMILTNLRQLIATAPTGRVLREGVATAIVGAPNAGKSSLLNRLLREERAIVSPTPGTTRDTIEAECQLGGVLLRLIDTAGRRATNEAVEAEGVSRAEAALQRAQLVLHVVDGHEAPAIDGIDPERLSPGQQYLRVANKADLGLHEGQPGDVVALSALTGAGLDTLERRVAELLLECPAVDPESWLTVNARQESALRRAETAAARAREQLHAAAPPELISVDLRAALDAVGEVVGASTNEDILDQLFATFCIGK
ncbi:MAG: tRNA uridine-5-carboxymethylaminomethyl(34) synthesis GTPase MnmE [Verrucomicrobiota bacterium]